MTDTFALTGQGFRGTIPKSIEKLTLLHHFMIRKTEVHGTIPSELGSLRQMSLLNLEDNRFTGTVPTELGLLRKVGKCSNSDKLTGTLFPGSLTLFFRFLD